ncbi:chemotaxis protein CheW [Aetokthonos hydrillicola]|uniref:chemotaxis protein CheW n=2 Tax=Aetokthonos hydrillicola TaxID=1550245 RepID=UPI001ABBBEB1|nr:purine-binding chemotaxis protein CheW [Aetokthonos hydrillicola CCALA 1050]
MLMLLFYVGDDLYALDSSQVTEIIPRVLLRKVHHVPDYVVGSFNYRGMIVPVIDLCHLIQGNPSRSYLSTRIIMVNYIGKDKTKRYLGLMGERVTETLNKPNTELMNIEAQLDETSYLGGIIMDDRRMIQLIRLENLLSDSQHKYLLAGEYS